MNTETVVENEIRELMKNREHLNREFILARAEAEAWVAKTEFLKQQVERYDECLQRLALDPL